MIVAVIITLCCGLLCYSYICVYIVHRERKGERGGGLECTWWWFRMYVVVVMVGDSFVGKWEVVVGGVCDGDYGEGGQLWIFLLDGS